MSELLGSRKQRRRGCALLACSKASSLVMRMASMPAECTDCYVFPDFVHFSTKRENISYLWGSSPKHACVASAFVLRFPAGGGGARFAQHAINSL